jgi:hypothetical protein
MFTLKDKREKNDESLCQYYINRFKHLIPAGVELWEYDEVVMSALRIY